MYVVNRKKRTFCNQYSIVHFILLMMNLCIKYGLLIIGGRKYLVNYLFYFSLSSSELVSWLFKQYNVVLQRVDGRSVHAWHWRDLWNASDTGISHPTEAGLCVCCGKTGGSQAGCLHLQRPEYLHIGPVKDAESQSAALS